MIKRLKWLSVISTFGMTLILLGGALVTESCSVGGVGSSCPLFNVELLPSDISPAFVIELSHRIVSGVVGSAVLLLAIFAWRFIGHIREVNFLSVLSFVFLVIQGLIGAAAVVWGQSDFVLAAHFGISLISFAAVFLLMLLIFEIDRKFDTSNLLIQKRHRIEIYALTIYTIIVVYTGALVRHVDANLVCIDWPFCFNSSPFAFSDYSFMQWVQMGHRLAAGILFIWTILLFIKVGKHYRHIPVMYWGWIITLALITFQVIFGALIILTLLNLGVALLHALFITGYFGMLSYFILLANRSAKAEKEQSIEKPKNKAYDPSVIKYT